MVVGDPPRPSWDPADRGGRISGQLLGRPMAGSSGAARGAKVRSRCITISSYISPTEELGIMADAMGRDLTEVTSGVEVPR